MTTSLSRRIFLALLLTLVASPALADDPAQVSVDVTIVEASKKDGPVDPRVKPFQDQLDDFAYKSFKLLSEKSVSVPRGGKQMVGLPNGKTLTVGYTKVDKDGRVRLRLAIDGVVSTSVSLAKGGSVVLGGPALPHGESVLFVPVTLSK